MRVVFARRGRSHPLGAACLLAFLATPLLARPVGSGQGVDPYRNHAALSGALQALAAAHPARTQLATVATSPGGRVIQALRVGAGRDVGTRPALLVVANAYGPHLIGSEAALHSAQSLLEGYGKDAAVTALLDRSTVWFIPRLNPDAAEGLFGAVRMARVGNDFPKAATGFVSGQSGADQHADLNRDGVVTMMRVRDAAGGFVADSIEPALMRRADPARERAEWAYRVEGRSEETATLYGQEGPGGTDVNQNFPHAYAHHGVNAGIHTMSEPEAAGMAEFMIAHPEIAAVYVIGPQDNLLSPWQNRPNAGIADSTGRRAQEGTSAGGPLNSIMAADQGIFADVSSRYQKVTGITQGAGLAAPGNLLDYFYYITGRWSFGARAWTVPDAPRDPAATGNAALRPADALAAERNALRWFRAQKIDAFVPWQAATVPGESRSVEVGGFRPGVLLNPPAGAERDSTLARQDRFIATLAGMLPRIAFRDARVEKLGEGVWRVTVELANDGTLPTLSALGNRVSPDPRGIRLVLEHGAAVLQTGTRIERLTPIAGGGRSLSRTWTLVAPAGTTLTLTASAPTAGSATQSITLR